RLYETLVYVLSQHAKWVDQRHLKTLAWMMVGLLQAGGINLTAWAPYVGSRARYAQSTVRRFRRWLDNDKIDVLSLYGPLLQQALAEWGEQALYVALDTSMLWNTYCLIRLAVIYRGRAVPLVWCVLEHGSAQVGFETYRELLERAAVLLPRRCKVIFLADRGFADTDLMAHLGHLGWHWRIRIKRSFWLSRRGCRRCKVERLAVARGQACFWHQVSITAKHYGPVYLAVAQAGQGQDAWYVLSDEPTDMQTFQEYGLRFDIEENFLDDTSNGFQLESSLIRSAPALTRLCVVLADGQKTRNQLDNRVYDSAIAHSATCILSTPSRILAPREGRTNGGGQTHGLEDTARVYHRDRRSRTAGAQRIPGDRESHPAPSAQRARAVE